MTQAFQPTAGYAGAASTDRHQVLATFLRGRQNALGAERDQLSGEDQAAWDMFAEAAAAFERSAQPSATAPNAPRAAFDAWEREEKLRTFPAEYDPSRLADWGTAFTAHRWAGYQAGFALGLASVSCALPTGHEREHIFRLMEMVRQLARVSDAVGRSRGSNNYALNTAAVTRFVDMMNAIETALVSVLTGRRLPDPSASTERVPDDETLVLVAKAKGHISVWGCAEFMAITLDLRYVEYLDYLRHCKATHLPVSEPVYGLLYQAFEASVLEVTRPGQSAVPEVPLPASMARRRQQRIELADWHAGEACHARKAARAGTAAENVEPVEGCLLRRATWHDQQAELLRAP